MYIQYSPRRFYPNLADSCRARDLRIPPVFPLFAFQSKLLHAHTWKYAVRDERRKRIRVFARHWWIRLDSTRTYWACVLCILYRRARIGCVFLRGVSIRNVARGEARCERGRGVSCTLLYYFSGIIYFRLSYLHRPRNRIPGDESGETRVTMSSAMRVNNVLPHFSIFSILSSTFARLIVLAIFHFCMSRLREKILNDKREKIFLRYILSINLKHSPHPVWFKHLFDWNTEFYLWQKRFWIISKISYDW